MGLEQLNTYIARHLPNNYFAFLCILLVQTLAVIYLYITDCDETFNYWEPTHFLHHNKGLQTWELSPQYGLRSYAYLYPQLFVGFIGSTLGLSKIAQFYLIRFAFAIFCSLSLTYFYSAIVNIRKPLLSFLSFLFFLVPTGMFISGVAYLPSTFAMYLLTISQAAWLSNNYPLAIFSVAAAALVGWPFCALVGVPLALYVIVTKFSIIYLLKWSIISAIICLVPTVFIDSYHYQNFRLLIAPLNIVLYNVFSGGSELYGVEPWHYYLMNGFLNFNFVLIFALSLVGIAIIRTLISLLVSEKKPSTKDASLFIVNTIVYHAPMYIWFVFMSTIAHKEERFLFVIYPQIAFAAAYGLYLLIDIFSMLKLNSKLISSFLFFVLVIIVAVSVSRTVGLIRNYDGSMRVFTDLSQNSVNYEKKFSQQYDQVNVCIGKEWYRFPSSYFLPQNYNLTFIRQSERNSQLPQYYGSTTSEIRPHFNDRNEDEPTRYIALDDCHFVLDLDYHENREKLFPPNQWELLSSFPFIDVGRSPTLSRAFYIPFYSSKKNSYFSFFLLRNINK